MTANVPGVADVPALAFRQPGKLFKSSGKSKCQMIILQPVFGKPIVEPNPRTSGNNYGS
jgi:hypothetical protein